MSALAVVIWVVNIVFDTAGQLSFKAAAVRSSAHSGLDNWRDMARHCWLWLGVCCYIGEFICWVAFLSMVPLSIGVMLASINIVAIMVAGRIFFAEKLTRWRLAGLALVTAGVALVGLSGP